MQETKLSFEKDIKPLFRELDIESMIPFGLDLSSYQDVRTQAQGILESLSDGTMPCDEAWSDEKIEKFKRGWMRVWNRSSPWQKSHGVARQGSVVAGKTRGGVDARASATTSNATQRPQTITRTGSQVRYFPSWTSRIPENCHLAEGWKKLR